MPQSIGTRRESSLHRDLKFRYAGPHGRTEAEVGGFVADGINAAGEYIEVQIGNFAPLKKKAEEFALLGNVRIIHPVIVAKYIEVFNKRKKLLYRRKSPKKGCQWDLFNALVHAPLLPLISGLIIELILIDAGEQRVQDGKGSWRRQGVSIKDRSLLAIHERIVLKKPADYRRFIPFKTTEEFTSGLLAEKAGIRVDMARKTLYTLAQIGIVKRTGKKGNTQIYRKK